jgi:hypothetical protein
MKLKALRKLQTMRNPIFSMLIEKPVKICRMTPSSGRSSFYYESISPSGSSGSIHEQSSTWELNLPKPPTNYKWYRIDIVDYAVEYVKAEDKNWARGNHHVHVREVYSQEAVEGLDYADPIRGHSAARLGEWVGDNYVVGCRVTRRVVYKPIHSSVSPPEYTLGSLPTNPSSDSSSLSNFVNSVFDDVGVALDASESVLEALRDSLLSFPVPSGALSLELGRINSALASLNGVRSNMFSVLADLAALPPLAAAYGNAAAAYKNHLDATRALQEQLNDLQVQRDIKVSEASWNNNAASSVGSDHPLYSGFISARDQLQAQISSLDSQISDLSAQISGRSAQQNSLFSAMGSAESAYSEKLQSVLQSVYSVLSSNWVGM